MRTGAAAHHCGYFHEAAFYGSDDELADIVVPFLVDGQAAGEPTLVTLDARNTAVVRAALPSLDGIAFVPSTEQYRNPAQTIADYRRRFAQLVAEGAEQIRVVGDVPHPGTGGSWDVWSRYEAAVNHAYAEFPLWGVCPYDVRVTPEHVLADVRRTHPHEALPAGAHRANPAYEDPAAYLATRPAPPPLPEQHTPPALVLTDPSPGHARRAVEAAIGANLEPAARDDAVLAASEIVTNAWRHGRPPITITAWVAPGRLVLTVEDHGDGPPDPLVGLLPQSGRPQGDGGLGLWMAHQVCTDVRHLSAGTHTVRIVVEAPSAG
jgi:anti-sigma regulatory factor (Ser/Thr protein kinase)